MTGALTQGLMSNEGATELHRFQKFWHVLHELLIEFETEPTLSAVKITAVATVNYEKIPLSVRIGHHFKVEKLYNGTSKALVMPDGNDWAAERLPYQEMGNGAFFLKREDKEVQEFLSLVDSKEDSNELNLDYLAVLSKLGFRMDSAFEPCAINHDIGHQVLSN